MSETNRKDGFTDLIQALPTINQSEPPQAPGTVIAADGSIVTLGGSPSKTS